MRPVSWSVPTSAASVCWVISTSTCLQSSVFSHVSTSLMPHRRLVRVVVECRDWPLTRNERRHFCQERGVLQSRLHCVSWGISTRQTLIITSDWVSVWTMTSSKGCGSHPHTHSITTSQEYIPSRQTIWSTTSSRLLKHRTSQWRIFRLRIFWLITYHCQLIINWSWWQVWPIIMTCYRTLAVLQRVVRRTQSSTLVRDGLLFWMMEVR